MSKGVQRAAEALQVVADLQDAHVRQFQLATHESIKDAAHPARLYAVSRGYGIGYHVRNRSPPRSLSLLLTSMTPLLRGMLRLRMKRK